MCIYIEYLIKYRELVSEYNWLTEKQHGMQWQSVILTAGMTRATDWRDPQVGGAGVKDYTEGLGWVTNLCFNCWSNRCGFKYIFLSKLNNYYLFTKRHITRSLRTNDMMISIVSGLDSRQHRWSWTRYQTGWTWPLDCMDTSSYTCP